MENIQDIIKKCNKCLEYRYTSNKKRYLSKIFPMGECMKSHYKDYNDSFFRDIDYVLQTLPVVFKDLGDDDVVFWICIDC